jgi:outer membrane beta-barrel protein
VRQLRVYREGRIMVAPTAGFTLLDEFRRAIFVGGKVHYNIKEWLSVGVLGQYALGDMTTDLTSQVNQTAPRDVRTASNVSANFSDQVSKMTFMVAPEAQFIPFRGKLAIFQKIFVDTDAYLHAGAAFVGVEERGSCGDAGQPACSDPASYKHVSRVAVAPTFGLGLAFYPTDWMSFGFEWRAFPFSWNRAGFDTRGAGTDGRFPDGKVNGSDSTFAFNQLVGIVIGFYPQRRGSSE